MPHILLGLGSNLGDRKANLKRALDLLTPHLKPRAISSLYETQPVGYEQQPDFVNAALLGETQESPERVLTLCKEVEAALGRGHGPRYGPRPADVDLLFYGNLVTNTPDLTLPHPRLAERAFVLVPLAEIAPEFMHPVLGRTAGQLLAGLRDTGGVRLWEGPGWWLGARCS